MKTKIENALKPSIKLVPIKSGTTSKLENLNGIKAVIFDIYGTLLISGSGDVGTAIEKGSSESFAKALSICGYPNIEPSTTDFFKSTFFNLIDEEHQKSKASGIPFPEIDIIKIWQVLLKQASLNLNFTEALNINPEYISAVYESIVNPVYPMPNLDKILEILKSKSLKLGIISNAQFYTPLIFNTLLKEGLDGYGFDKNLRVYSFVEKRAKPDRELYKIMKIKLSQYDIIPEQTLYVGNDMLKDIMPASKEGFKTALFAGDKRSLRLRENESSCSNIIPDVIVNDLIELTDCIQEG
ncbi:MAG: HAD family hydrolase [Spirochaetales bacterium]|nr:HAD family hydrolase [Spirochaetales bacterium]